MIRDDLADEQDVFRVSIIENEARKTYSDPNRGDAILRYREKGYKYEDFVPLFGVGKRRLERLKRIPGYPQVLQDTLVGKKDRAKLAHTFVLEKMMQNYEDFDLENWIEAISDKGYNANELKKVILKEYEEKQELSIFVAREKVDEDDGYVGTRYLIPRGHIAPDELEDEEKWPS